MTPTARQRHIFALAATKPRGWLLWAIFPKTQTILGFAEAPGSDAHHLTRAQFMGQILVPQPLKSGTKRCVASSPSFRLLLHSKWPG
jgi:hypothetical protein